MVARNAPTTRKKTASKDDLNAVEMLQRIRTGTIKTPQELAKLKKQWLNDMLSEALEAKREDGEEGFWRVIDALAIDHPELKDLRSLLEIDAPPEPQEEKPDPYLIRNPNGKTLLKLFTVEDIYALPDAEYLIAGMFETATVGMIYAQSGRGKTFTSLGMALSVAHGVPWLGRKTKQGPVWYINTEGGRGLKKRLQAWYHEHEHLSPTSDFKIIPWSVDIRECYQIILDTIEAGEHPPIMICIDNFSMCAPGVNQNHQEEIAPVLRLLNQLAQDYGCFCLIVHHTNKEDDFNGSMAFRNHVDTMIELKKEDKNDKNSPIIISSQKTRDDEPFSDIRVEMKQVIISVDDVTAQTKTSCVIVATEQPEPEKTTPEAQRQMLEVLKLNKQLTTERWGKLCLEVHKITRATFYRNLKTLTREELIVPVDEKLNGKSLHYALTEKGAGCIE